MVQWFRAKAGKERADEAVNKICAEFRRTAMAYGRYSEMWQRGASSATGGERAYALKTAAMWARMQRQCTEEYDGARREGVPPDRLDHTRVSVHAQVYDVC